MSVIDLSKTTASIDVKKVDKVYEIRFLRDNSLNVTRCMDDVLPNVLAQIIRDGHTLIKVNLI